MDKAALMRIMEPICRGSLLRITFPLGEYDRNSVDYLAHLSESGKLKIDKRVLGDFNGVNLHSGHLPQALFGEVGDNFDVDGFVETLAEHAQMVEVFLPQGVFNWFAFEVKKQIAQKCVPRKKMMVQVIAVKDERQPGGIGYIIIIRDENRYPSILSQMPEDLCWNILHYMRFAWDLVDIGHNLAPSPAAFDKAGMLMKRGKNKPFEDHETLSKYVEKVRRSRQAPELPLKRKKDVK